MQGNSIGGVHKSWAPFLFFKIWQEEKKDTVCILKSNRDLAYAEQLVQKLFPQICVLTFPEYETAPDDKIPFDPLVATARANCLASLRLIDSPKLVLITKDSLTFLVPPCSFFEEVLLFKTGEEMTMINCQNTLKKFGYQRTGLVEKQGQFTVRGGLIDVFPINSPSPFRIDFFGDVIESIKTFDPTSQLSIKKIPELLVTKASEIPMTEESLQIFEKKNKDCDERTSEALKEYGTCNGLEWCLDCFFEENLISFWEYCKRNNVLLCPFDIDLPDVPKSFKKIKTFPLGIEGENFAVPNSFEMNIRTAEGFQAFVKDSAKFKKTVVSLHSQGVRYVFENICKEQEFDFSELSIIESPLTEGFIDLKNDIAYYCEKQLFGYVLKRNTETKKKLFKNYSNIIPGNHVVHKKHGIAIFEGLRTIEVSGIKHDFLTLLYKNDDKLFVPVENIELVSRYGEAEGTIELDKLGSSSWANRKEKVKKKLLVIASGLLKIAALRKTTKVEPVEIDNDRYELFRKGFPYIETDDQASAIEEVLEDLKSDIPMDRLVCGDVGFGKTEVAMRAAFAVSDFGRQVVVLAPTTILANQHFNNFSKRFYNFEIEVCQLSRFISQVEMKRNIQKIETGEAKIIIGTHAIINSKIKFNNLGLLIVDEEQHFGVKQKEFLKSLKANIHILTMTATPIPRTLQMALSGLRDLSLIASPPLDRLPVKTFLVDFSFEEIKKIVAREFSRGGQVFVVSPRIEFLADLLAKFERMFPKAAIRAVHGKSSNMEKIITDFYEQRIDIIISTNIIDSGIDIQNANTILIYRPDMFGLSQLHQLRGRVGRKSNVQGYCYLMPQSQKKLSSEAEQRLSVLQNLNSLGSGFSIASQDLDIRGAGNIVGDEQSGHIRDVGVELYQKMLEGAILMKDIDDNFAAQINLGVPILIPDSYIEDKNLRVTIYKRIGDLSSLNEIESMEIELSDRFGPPPKELQNLLTVIKIKLYCLKANIEKIDVGKNGILISFYKNQSKNTDRLLNFIAKNQSYVKIRPDQKVTIQKKWRTTEERTLDVLKISKFLSE